LEPITLSEGLMEEVTDIARHYAYRCDREKIPCKSFWQRGGEAGATESAMRVEDIAARAAKRM